MLDPLKGELGGHKFHKLAVALPSFYSDDELKNDLSAECIIKSGEYVEKFDIIEAQ